MNKKFPLVIILFFQFSFLFAFECFGVKEGYNRKQCEAAGTVFNEIIENNGTYQKWKVTPAAKNRGEDLVDYYFFIDDQIGLYRVDAVSNYKSTKPYPEKYIYSSMSNLLINYRNKLKKKYGVPQESEKNITDLYSENYHNNFYTWELEGNKTTIYLTGDSYVLSSEGYINSTAPEFFQDKSKLVISYANHEKYNLVLDLYAENQMQIL